ncbi:MAG: tetratricopeptide repeat protein [Candidatus Thorarchaeota archaeon]|nr:tetratricopeptide repeat protein [Candidatus Thorarchaeota archaeon]
MGFLKRSDKKSDDPKKDTKKAHELFVKAEKLKDKGDYKKAEKLLDDSIKLDSSNNEAWLSKAAMCIVAKKYKDSIEASRESIRLDERNPRAWGALAVALGDSGKHDEAEEALLKAIELEPNGKGWLFALGGLYLQQNKWAEAQEQLERVVEIDPEFLPAHHFLVKVYTAQVSLATDESAREKFALKAAMAMMKVQGKL